MFSYIYIVNLRIYLYLSVIQFCIYSSKNTFSVIIYFPKKIGPRRGID